MKKRLFFLHYSYLIFFLFICSLLEAQTTNIFPLNGFVGIGTTTPESSIDAIKNQDAPTLISITNPSNGAGAAAGLKIASQNGFSALFRTSNTFAGYPGNTTILGDFAGGDIAFFGAAEIIRFKNNGFVGIGTSVNPNPSDLQLKLAVNGNIYAKKLKITQQSWADYVFEPNYKLMPLSELEMYIEKNKHLPDVPSAVEVETTGLDLGDNQAILLKKIEELTLYVIQLKKEIETIKVQHITKNKSK